MFTTVFESTILWAHQFSFAKGNSFTAAYSLASLTSPANAVISGDTPFTASINYAAVVQDLRVANSVMAAPKVEDAAKTPEGQQIMGQRNVLLEMD